MGNLHVRFERKLRQELVLLLSLMTLRNKKRTASPKASGLHLLRGYASQRKLDDSQVRGCQVIRIAIKTSVRAILAIILMAVMGPVFATTQALAQVATVVTSTPGAGSLGTTVTTNGPTIQITGGTRPGGGRNLFHSFDQFNVASGNTAQFLNTTPSLLTSNILSRVTGGNPSSIFGAIDTTSYPSANLFFMNPAGIVFGPNATLNVNGSVALTTADYLRLASADGSNAGIFRADPTAARLLTSSSVSAFGFLGTNPSAIYVQGTQNNQLRVQPGQSISLVGGNQGFTYTNPDTGTSASTLDGVTVTGKHLFAPGGQIKIASVASQGEVLAGNLEKASNINSQSFGTFGTVQILKQSHIDTSGESGGRILVKGGRLLVDDSTISANSTKAATSGAGRRLDPSWLGIGIEVEVAQDAIIDNGSVIETNVEFGAKHGSGGVRITADHITVSGGPKILASLMGSQPSPPPFAGIRSNIGLETAAAGSGGVSLDATTIQVKDVGQIQTLTEGTGRAGDISIKASGDITLMMAIVSSGSVDSSGHAGDIALSSTQGNVNIANSFVTSQTNGSSGNAGAINMSTLHGNISLVDGTQVLNATRGTTGTLGSIQIVANNLLLNGRSSIAGNNFTTPVAGNIAITLDSHLSVTEGSFIQTTALGPANAADLIVKARDVLIADGGSLQSGTNSSGAGGTIDVTATNQVSLTNNASITASSTAKDSGNAGDIKINAGQQLELTNGSSITTTTESAQANGGNIDIRAIDRIRLVDSTISTSVKGTEGSGGNIFIDPKVVILQGSNVTAQAVGGAGGQIKFVTPLFLADSASTVSAQSQRGPNGTVTIQSPTANLSGAVGQLASKTSPPQVLLQNRCVALAGGEQSTFILAGRDTLPIEPGGWLRSPVSMEHWTGEDMEHASGLMVRRNRSKGLPRMIRPMDKTQVLSLRG
ncbi:MAG: filamentous hemagglutinin N-terminal domain-containing protein, partial [Nitrospira sp.]